MTWFINITCPAQQPPVELCEWSSASKPNAIRGSQGTSSKETYWFAHLSDVDQKESVNHFVFAVKNNHSSNYLPIEWVSRGGSVQLAFDRIVPGGCGANDFETSLGYIEDDQATIKYGPLAQEKKIAPFFAKPDKKIGNAAFQRPLLKSTIVADVLDEGIGRRRVHLEFTTLVNDRQFTYSVLNKGETEESFEISALSSLSGDAEKERRVNDLQFKSRWDEKMRVFSVPAQKEPRIQVIVATAEHEPSEEIVTIEVLSRKRVLLVRGRLSLYLPRRIAN
jgi:hypothetical protein